MWRTTLPILLLAMSACGSTEPYEPQDGDIIFHTSKSAQSVAIQKATRSRYSHMGLVYLKDQRPFVLEAVEPVKITPLDEWIDRGIGDHFVVKRLRNAGEVLTPGALRRMQDVGEGFIGRHYDLYFEWSDRRIYCSELVWKIYKRALNIEVGERQVISDFDLSDPAVQAKLKERWNGAPPANETVVSPGAMFNSDLLMTVFEQ